MPCGAINNLAEVFEDPQVRARGMVTEWHNHPLNDALRLVSSPLKLSRTPVRAHTPPPLLGANTNEVLQELLGKSAADITALRDAGVI